MVALSEYDTERAFFHLGYGSAINIDVGDVDRLSNAINDIRSDYIRDQIINILDRCDRIYADMDITTTSFGTIVETYIGDINRSVTRVDLRDVSQLLRSTYQEETDRLAKILAVSNYNSPYMDQFRYSHDNASTYIKNTVLGPADTSIASRRVDWYNWHRTPIDFIAVP